MRLGVGRGKAVFGRHAWLPRLTFCEIGNDAEHMHANLQGNAIIQGFDFMSERMKEPHSFSRSSFLLAHEFEPPFILSLFRLTVLAYHPDVSLYIRRFPAVLDNYDSGRTSTFPSSSGILWIGIEK